MAACASCKDPLVLGVDGPHAGADEEVIPDDLLLPCGCHFHWQCLLDEAARVVSSMSCPSCTSYLSSPSAAAASSSSSSSAVVPTGVQILTRYLNEGGLQENYDIFPDLTEEAYLEAHPEARPARAFLTMCAAGDVEGIVGLIADDDDDDRVDDDDDDGTDSTAHKKLSPEEILRYQDPLGSLQTGLHVAIENNREEVAYLLLFLASQLPFDAFPPAVLQQAEQGGLVRPASVASHADIRSLPDQRGDTAGMLAGRKGGPWTAWVQGGLL